MKVQTRQKDRAVDNRGAIDWTIRALDTRMSHIGLKTFLFWSGVVKPSQWSYFSFERRLSDNSEWNTSYTTFPFAEMSSCTLDSMISACEKGNPWQAVTVKTDVNRPNSPDAGHQTPRIKPSFGPGYWWICPNVTLRTVCPEKESAYASKVQKGLYLRLPETWLQDTLWSLRVSLQHCP